MDQNTSYPYSFGYAEAYETSSGTELTGTVQGVANSIVYANVVCRSQFTAPVGWTILHESPVVGVGDTNQHQILLYKKIDSDGTVSFTAKQTTAARIYINLLCLVGAKEIVYHTGSEYIDDNHPATNPFTLERPNYDTIIWTATSCYWSTTSSENSWTVNGNVTKIYSNSNNQPRLLSVFDSNNTQETITFRGYSTGNVIADYVEVQFYTKTYSTDGSATFDIPEITRMYNYETSTISWEEDIPEGTSLTVEAKVDDEEYLECTNGEPIPGLISGESYAESSLVVRARLHTDDTTISPSISNMSIMLKCFEDSNTITLVLAPGNVNSIQNANGEVTVSYQGGTLKGSGGPVAAFEESFTPTGLTDKSDRIETEHIAVSLQPVGILTRIYYSDTKCDEHIEVSITPRGVLTHVDDI